MKSIQKLLADWQRDMGIKPNDDLKLSYFGFPGPRTRRKMMERKCDYEEHTPERTDSLMSEAESLFGKMREATPEETEGIKQYILQHCEETHDKRTETHGCVYCNEDECGFVKPIEKNSHAFLYRGMFEWNLELRAKGWKASVPIKFCPMCGRRLER